MFKRIAATLCIIFFFAPMLYSAQVDLGDDINFEYRYVRKNRVEYESEFRQRIKLYLTGHLKNDVEVGLSLQSAGVMNSTQTFVIYQGAQINNLDPFFDKAYVRINNYYGYPVSLTIGKIPLVWADGLLINDNQLGLPAIHVKADAPYDIKVEAYHCRTRNALLDISGIKGYGVRSMRDFGFMSLELDWTYENYISSQEVKRYIYGANVTRNMHRGLFYNFFGYKMKGEKGLSSFDGYAIGAKGKFEGRVDPIGKGGFALEYTLGSGDELDDESGFLPILSSVSSDILGDYYGRYREYRRVFDGANSIASTEVDLSHTIANLSLFRQTIYATLRDDVDVFIIRSTYKKHRPELPLGGAFTMGARYRYEMVNFQIRYTAFTPEDSYDQPLSESGHADHIYTVTVDTRF